MWLTQLGDWSTALERQNAIDGDKPVQTFESFNTRMICCEYSEPDGAI
jgi:hypothetical protein